jgi:hypothetical protein
MYDNLIEVVIQYDCLDDHDEMGYRMKMQPFKLMINQAVVTFFQKFFDFDFTKKKTELQNNLNIERSQISSTISES